MAKSDPLQRAPGRPKLTKEAEKAAEEAPPAEDAPPPATSATAVADVAGDAPDETETRIHEADAEASADLPDGFGSGEPGPSRDGHDTIVDGEPPTSSPSDAVTEYRDRDEIPTDAAGLEEYARNEIADAIAGPGDSLLAGTGFGSGDLDRSPLDGAHSDNGPIGIAQQGTAGVSDGVIDAWRQRMLRPATEGSLAGFITSNLSKDPTLSHVRTTAAGTVISETANNTLIAEFTDGKKVVTFPNGTKSVIEVDGATTTVHPGNDVENDVVSTPAKKAEAAPAVDTPDEEDFDPDSVGGRIARDLRASMAPRGGGGDGHTDPADDVEAIVRSGALPDSQETLLGGDTRGDTGESGGNHGVPDRDAGTIDPTDETDFGSGAGREIDPLTDDGPALDFNAGNRIDSDTDDTDLGIGDQPGTPQQISRQTKPSKAPDKEQEAGETRAADARAADATGHNSDATLVDEATRAASQGFGDGAGTTEADPTRDGHDTIIDDDASAPTAGDAIPGARGEIPTDTAGLEDYARDQIDAALFGQGDALLADTGFASRHDLDQIDLGHAGSSPGSIADQGIGGVASGMTDADEQNKLNRFLTRKAETVEEVSPYIDQTPTSEWAEELEWDESHDAYFTDPETKLQVAQQMEDYDARLAEADLIEARVQEAEFKEEKGIKTPDEERLDPDSVGGRIARALRESTTPRGGGGDGHTDPADDATPITKGGQITDTQDALLGGTTRGTAETGGNHGVPDLDAGTIDPTDETDFGSGAGREIDPLADDGPALDFDAGNRIDSDTDDTDLGIGDLMIQQPTLLHEAALFSGSLEFDRTHAVAIDDEPNLDDDLDD